MRKRGMVLVVVVLILFSSIVFGLDPESLVPNTNKFIAWYFVCDDCDGSCEEFQLSCSDAPANKDLDHAASCPFLPAGTTTVSDPIDYISDFDAECSYVSIEPLRPPNNGCLAIGNDEDQDMDDDCAYKYIYEGFIFATDEYKRLPNTWGKTDKSTLSHGDSWSSPDNDEGDKDDGGECILNLYDYDDPDDFERDKKGVRWKSLYPGEHICSEDHYWHGCLEDEDVGTIVWAKNYLYECSDADGFLEWVEKGIDADHDGYSPEMGDCDDTTGGDPTDIDCPESKNSCTYKTSKCAICINPGAPEVCGDGLNNDCGGPGVGESLGERDGRTSDYCYKNEYACGKKKMETDGPVHTNIYDESFSWQNISVEVFTGEGFCCGFTGVHDLGLTGTDEVGNNYICLNKDEENPLVGYEEFDSWSSDCGENWCLVDATSDAAFHIFTIRDPGETVYDVISNNKDWYKCDEEGTKEISSDVSGVDDIEKANRFYCYKEGNRWSWADCLSQENLLPDNGIKSRERGDGLFALKIDEDPAKSTDFTKTIDLDYSSFYEEDTKLDITEDIEYLEFRVQFDSEEEVNIPAEIVLDIEYSGGIRFIKSVLAYATNNPLIEEGRWIHVKFPMQGEMLGVTGIKIYSTGDNKIDIKNIYLSNGDKPLMCSGESSETSRPNGVWFDSVDFWEIDSWNAKDLCNDLYDPEGGRAWLGDEEVADDERMCCGDDKHEYYSGESREKDGKKYGCWNSQIIGSGDTTMNIMFKVGDEEYTYSCPQEAGECIYPLPGESPYKITNLYPELYELYFVKGNGPADEFLITSPDQEFSEAGNLMAKKVAQQVIFINEEDEETGDIEQGFFGCEAAKFIRDLESDEEKVVEDMNYCSVKGGKFCAYQDGYEKEYILINSWSEELLFEWGYRTEPNDEMEFELTAGDELVDEISAEDRVWPTTVVPGRNFVPNADFVTEGRELPGWEIFGEKTDERDYVTDGVVELGEGERLKSEKIAVSRGKRVLFTAGEGTTCEPKIILYDKDGNFPTAALIQADGRAEYYTDYASYLILEFTGACEITQPMLQVMDDLGAAEYSYKAGYLERAGAACCPQDWCWNGYACVREMSEWTYMAEKIGEERFYRCIEGEWKYTPFQWDWNFDGQGFCSEESQCFVLSDLEEGRLDHTIEDVYEKGRFPICVDDGEFIFDHYCDNGKWTSRTKFLALSLLEAYGDDDYVLYCTDYRGALPDHEASEDYLGGEKEMISGLLGSTEEVLICFNSLLGTEEGKRLVGEEDNTCINNACILKSEDEIFFATSLNDNKAIGALGIPANALGTICEEGEGFVECDIGEFAEGELLYADEINGIIYTKKEIGLGDTLAGVLGSIWDFLFGDSSEEVIEFVSGAVNFNDLYILDKDDKRVMAKREIFSAEDESLVAEYENFDTAICEYVDIYKIDTPTGVSVLEESPVVCEVEEETQKISISEDLGFWWPQLTGRLRVDWER